MATTDPKTVTLKNGQQMCIRTPVAEDAQGIIGYLKEVFADDRFFLTTAEEANEWLTIEKQQERIENCRQDNSKLLLVTDVRGQIVSISDIECGPRKRRRHIGQIGISILPQYRRIGLGTAILQVMVEWATAHPHIEKLALGVWASNEPAIQLYQKLGFIAEGRKVRDVKYANGYYDDCLLMYKMV